MKQALNKSAIFIDAEEQEATATGNFRTENSFNNEGFFLLKAHKKTSCNGEPYLYIGYPVNQCINNDDGTSNRYKASKSTSLYSLSAFCFVY